MPRAASLSILAVLAVPVLAGSLHAQIVAETFESTAPGGFPAGWSAFYAGAGQSVVNSGYYGGKSFRLQAGPASAAESHRAFTPPQGKWTLSWAIRLDAASTAPTQGDAFLRYVCGACEISGGFFRNPGDTDYRLFIGTGATPLSIIPQLDRWYEFSAVVNPGAGVVVYYLDGVQVGTLTLPGPVGPGSLVAHVGAIDAGTLIANIDQVRVVVGAEPGLLAHYPFNGNFNDVSGNGFHASPVGGVTFDTGQIAQSASFNGTTGYAYADHGGRLTFDLDTQSYTAAGWVKINPSEQGPWFMLLDRWGSNAPTSMSLHGYAEAARRQVVANSWYGLGTGTNFQVIAAININLWYNQWHHVAVTFDHVSGTKSLYIDGTLVGTAARPSEGFPSVGWGTGNTRITIGGAWGSDGLIGNLLDGALDDIRVYNRALSEGEIALLAGMSGSACSIADVTSLGGEGGPDGQITVDDLIAFVNAFSLGC